MYWGHTHTHTGVTRERRPRLCVYVSLCCTVTTPQIYVSGRIKQHKWFTSEAPELCAETLTCSTAVCLTSFSCTYCVYFQSGTKKSVFAFYFDQSVFTKVLLTSVKRLWLDMRDMEPFGDTHPSARTFTPQVKWRTVVILLHLWFIHVDTTWHVHPLKHRSVIGVYRASPASLKIQRYEPWFSEWRQPDEGVGR